MTESSESPTPASSPIKSWTDAISPVALMRSAILRTHSLVARARIQQQPEPSSESFQKPAEPVDTTSLPAATNQQAQPSSSVPAGTWLISIGAFVLGFRGLMFPVAYYSARNAYKVNRIQAEIQSIKRIVAGLPQSTSFQQRGIAMKKMREELFRQYRLNKYFVFPWLPLVQIPIFVSTFIAMRQITAPYAGRFLDIGFQDNSASRDHANTLVNQSAESLADSAVFTTEQQSALGLLNGGMGSFTDLTYLDSSMVLPALNTLMLLIQVERSIQPAPSSLDSKESFGSSPSVVDTVTGGQKEPSATETAEQAVSQTSLFSNMWKAIRSPQMVDFMKVGVQGTIVLFFPLYAALPSGLLLFWCSNSAISLLQPYAIRYLLTKYPPKIDRRASSMEAPETALSISEQLAHKMKNAQQQLEHLQDAILQAVPESLDGKVEVSNEMLERVEQLIEARKLSGELTLPIKAMLKPDPATGKNFLALELEGTQPSNNGTSPEDPNAMNPSAGQAGSASPPTGMFSSHEQQQLSKLQEQVSQYVAVTPSEEVLWQVQHVIESMRQRGELDLYVKARINHRPVNGATPHIELVVVRSNV